MRSRLSLNGLTLRARLILTLSAVGLLLVLPALYGLQRLAEVRDIATDLRAQNAVAALALGRLETALAEVDSRYRRFLASPEPRSRASATTAVRHAEEQLGILADAGYEQDAALAAAAVEALAVATDRLTILTDRGELDQATDLFFDEARPRLSAAEAALDGLAAAIDRRGTLALRRAHEVGRRAATTIVVALILSLLVAVTLGLGLVDSLVRPVRGLRRAMAGVAGGELEPPGELDYERRDELGDLNRSFRAMTEQLTQLNRTKAEFVSIVTHDLKTPIHVVNGYAQMLRDGLYGPPAPEQQEALEALGEQVEVLLEQVDQLLDLSRIEAGAFRIDKHEVRLVDLCTSLRRSFEALARQKPVDFRVDLAPTAPETILADEHRLRNEVLANLVGNAFKFTDPGGRIHLRIAGADGHVEFEVEDDGRGIAPEELPNVFDKYYQGNGGRGGNGSGLGLAIAREISEAHGGAISVTSDPGRRTTFRVRIPTR